MQQAQNNQLPPDGGWGWVIVTASLINNIIGEGMLYSFGVSLPKLVNHFEEGKGTVALIGSLFSGFHLASGPIASVLINKYGCRVTCVMGSLIGMTSIALSSLCNSVIVLMIIYGICGGIGLGLVYLPSIVCVGQYFEKRRALAMGITSCGSGIGSIVMAPLSAFLLDHYDWRGGNLIMAGIILNCAVLGCLFKPLMPPITQRRDNQGDIKRVGCDVDKEVELATKSGGETKEKISSLINFKLMKNPVFLLICMSYMVAYLGLFIPYVYLIDLAITKGIEYKTASFLVSIIGITNSISRVLAGSIFDLPAVDPLTIIYLCTGISGVAVFCVPFGSSYTGFAVIAAVFGLFMGPFLLDSIIYVELLGISQLADAFGIALLMTSFTAIAGPPLAGFLFEWTGSYKWTFWVAGALLLLSSILLAVSYCVWRNRKRKEKQAQSAIVN